MYRIVPWALAAALLPAVASGSSRADELNVGGTGAVLGLLHRLGDDFANAHPGDKLNVIPGMGSSGGISAVAEGALQVSFSSRDLKPQERARGLEISPILETPFVFVTSNPQPAALGKSDVVAIYDGAMMSWPDGKPIKPILRPKSDSATDFLIANFDGMQSALDKVRKRPDVPVAATDQDNVDAAEKVENSFSGATLAQLITEEPRLRRTSIDGVDASLVAMENGTYLYKMTMSVVTKSERTPVVQRFMAFLQSAKAETIFRESGAAPVARETKR